jgi:hypothetical protein
MARLPPAGQLSAANVGPGRELASVAASGPPRGEVNTGMSPSTAFQRRLKAGAHRTPLHSAVAGPAQAAFRPGRTPSGVAHGRGSTSAHSEARLPASRQAPEWVENLQIRLAKRPLPWFTLPAFSSAFAKRAGRP